LVESGRNKEKRRKANEDIGVHGLHSVESEFITSIHHKKSNTVVKRIISIFMWKTRVENVFI